ncbi:MAG TPA: putative sugar nucleotidyl transferase [Gemmatimonadaceae bacterium]|nr:putative sugar nucleotidyl transferase [Gemmatimonadaceae bacterium]
MTSPSLVLYDDRKAREFAPFALTRPLGAMRVGAALIADRWSAAAASPTVGYASSPHLTTFGVNDGDALPATLDAGTIIANARCVIGVGVRLSDADAWVCGDTIAAVRLAQPLHSEALHDGGVELASIAARTTTKAKLDAHWLSGPDDIVRYHTEQLLRDTTAFAAAQRGDATVRRADIGEHPVRVEAGATIEPHVVFDTSAGPIVIGRHARVAAFTRIAGPCYIGEYTEILGGRISGSAIGEHCKIHGDVSTSVFVGHANKAHEGFVGHSIVGRWANLGAGTTTSNLKNSYGSVRIWSPSGDRDTGLTFLGSLIGDHAKLGIGTMLGTGTVIGAGANVFGTMRPPKRVPPFAWGDAPPYETFSIDKFLDVAARVMQRRNVTLTPAKAERLRAAHALASRESW